MQRTIFGFLASAALLASTSACAGLGHPHIASDTDRSTSSWCLGDRVIGFDPAPSADADDPGNAFDTDATVEAIMAHNARLLGACPEAESR